MGLGTWVFGGGAPVSAPAYGGIIENLAQTGSAWSEADGSNPGNYATMVTSGSTLTIQGDLPAAPGRGSITGVVIEEIPEPATMALMGLGSVMVMRRRSRRTK